MRRTYSRGVPTTAWSGRWWGLRLAPVALDALVAGTVGGVVLLDRFLGEPGPGTRPADLLSVVPVLVAVAGAAVRRLRPRTSLMAVLVALVLAALLREPDLGLLLLACLSAYAAAAGVRRLVLGATVGVLVLARLAPAIVVLPPPEAALGAALDTLLLLVAVLFGDASLARRARHEQRRLDERRQADHRLTQERVRLAREMHDVVAHAVTGMGMQADGAHGLAARDPDLVEAALRRIQESGRQATDELRALLGVLRVPGTSAPDGPQPSLAQLSTLATAYPALRVEVREHGPDAAVSTGVELAAYRIVQEALTNAVRHGAAHHVVVDIHRRTGEVRLDIRDDGHADGVAPTPGYGLTGMRERAAQHDGTLTAGPVDGGGWRVQALLRERDRAGV